MYKDSKRGFSIIELIFVLCILAIIFGIIIPIFPTIGQNMKIRTDRVSAGNVANAVKSWYVDYNSDDILKVSEDFLENKKELTKDGRKSLELSELVGLSKYIDVINTEPTSLLNENKVTVENQKFFVSLLNKDGELKVVVTIGTEGIEITDTSVVSYDGNSAGIIYIES